MYLELISVKALKQLIVVYNLIQKKEKWKVVANMNEARKYAACVVFQGNIVVSGGIYDGNILNSVESYDVFANKWSPMSNMINNHFLHSLVTVKSKLFVMDGREHCEVFDNVCEKFVVFKSSTTFRFRDAVSIGNKIVILQNETSSIICYDVNKDEWSQKPCELTKDLEDFSCLKLPLY